MFDSGKEQMLFRKKKIKIAKRLVSINYIALHDNNANIECTNKILEHSYDIAYEIGGNVMLEMVRILQDKLEKKNK